MTRKERRPGGWESCIRLASPFLRSSPTAPKGCLTFRREHLSQPLEISLSSAACTTESTSTQTHFLPKSQEWAMYETIFKIHTKTYGAASCCSIMVKLTRQSGTGPFSTECIGVAMRLALCMRFIACLSRDVSKNAL